MSNSTQISNKIFPIKEFNFLKSDKPPHWTTKTLTSSAALTVMWYAIKHWPVTLILSVSTIILFKRMDEPAESECLKNIKSKKNLGKDFESTLLTIMESIEER